MVTNYELDLDGNPTSKMLLWRLRWLADMLPGWAYDPILGCIICMASVHGTWFYFLTQNINTEMLITYPFYLLGVAGINYIISTQFFE